MLIAPVSLIFFSVPSSSSALARPAQNAATSARPIIRRYFIRTLLPWMTSGMPAKIGPEWDLTSIAKRAQGLMQWPGHCMSRGFSHRVGVRVGRIRRLRKCLLLFRTDRHAQIQPLRRDLLHEPFLIQLGAFGALVERCRGGIDHLLEGRVILAQHDAVGL